ncbi:tRNA uridine-5-carboxymethylaminomethyl(34) synthesis GTPase MnmE [Sphingomonas xanthus]|uniref:tRNA modification GTPase MnmE n=1 Tax=Sphingomonas xanthus TaxID=2594473 RepID=A0A516IRL1_9SPHN|nr:tRNA uridine-5-carboxymethylaminomethyl(34) synthesis GTPase MnmE [Sphingomonas xanthus]QDP19546.1 tRNA uridine-5-carboxymethylaminomethyl(34) synthesis GTPase MnmE [Sphingomonas xanthus]
MDSAGDTIVALSSGLPPAAIAVVRSSGPRAFAAAEKLAGRLPPPRQAALRSLTDPATGDILDRALLIRFTGPASATGEDLVEYHCHGGRATVDALLTALTGLEGIRLAQPGEFTRRALANGRMDLTEAQGLADLLVAETELQRRSAMARAGGALRQRLDGWRDRLLALSARAEVAIDYADEDDGASGDPSLQADAIALAREMGELLDAPRVEPLRDGVRVVLSGPPNAGKSSLLNGLTQFDRAIVSHLPGTTRDSIEVPLSIEGIPFLLVDTAGLRNTDDMIEAIGVGRAQEEAARADIILWLGDAEATADDPRVVQLRPKCDIHDGPGMRVSAASGEGLAELSQLLVSRAKQLLPRGYALALDRRQHDLLAEAESALSRTSLLYDSLLVAEELRVARHAIDRISGRAGVEDLLDRLFSRFCLGK